MAEQKGFKNRQYEPYHPVLMPEWQMEDGIQSMAACSGLTVEPGDGQGLEEHGDEDGVACGVLVQQGHHVHAALKGLILSEQVLHERVNFV